MFLPEILNLGKASKQYFEIVPALSETLIKEAYHIRHQVYCEDLKYESTREDKYESDPHDANSLHVLIRDVRSDEFIGCTRIIYPQPENINSLLPFEEICAALLSSSTIDSLQLQLPRHSIAEVSRLAVISRYRRRKGEQNKAISISDEDFRIFKQPRFPYIPVCLFIGTIELSRLRGIDSLFFLTEERLAKHFSKLGANLQFICGPIEHRGKRILTMVSISETISNMKIIFRPLYRTISKDIKRHIAADLEK